MDSKQNLSILSITLGRGGAEKVISLLLKELIHDYNVHLILFYNEIHFDIPKEVNVITLCNEKASRPFYLKAFDTLKFIFQYNNTLKKHKIKYTISFLAFPNLINGIISIINKKPKTFISERGFPSDNVSSKISLYISKIFYPIFYNRCYKLFSNSIYINKDLKENFGVKIPMEVIYNPIETPKKIIDSSSLMQKFNTLKVITAGTLNTRKNQIMIIRAIEKSNKKYELSVLGDGPLRSYLHDEIKSKKLEDQVFLKGSVKNVNDYLIDNHCFVLSSFTEGFPNALLEAMAIGLPSISTNCLSGPLELLHDNGAVTISEGDFFKAKYGILINNDDDIGLQKALDYLENNPSERNKYSKLSIERSKDYLLKNIYSQFNDFVKN